MDFFWVEDEVKNEIKNTIKNEIKKKVHFDPKKLAGNGFHSLKEWVAAAFTQETLNGSPK